MPHDTPAATRRLAFAFCPDFTKDVNRFTQTDVKFSIEHRIYYSKPSFLDTQTSYVFVSYWFINNRIESESEHKISPLSPRLCYWPRKFHRKICFKNHQLSFHSFFTKEMLYSNFIAWYAELELGVLHRYPVDGHCHNHLRNQTQSMWSGGQCYSTFEESWSVQVISRLIVVEF